MKKNKWILSSVLAAVLLAACTTEEITEVTGVVEDVGQLVGLSEVSDMADLAGDAIDLANQVGEIIDVRTGKFESTENHFPVSFESGVDGDTSKFSLFTNDINDSMYNKFLTKNGQEFTKKIINSFDELNKKGENVATIRYLLVDTPESKKPNTEKQIYSEDAAAFTENALKEAKQVTLVFDKGEPKDKYNRLLAYVYVDGKSLQELLLENGYARVAYAYEPNTTLLPQFEVAEEKAKKKDLNIWSIPGYVTEKGYNMDVVN